MRRATSPDGHRLLGHSDRAEWTVQVYLKPWSIWLSHTMHADPNLRHTRSFSCFVGAVRHAQVDLSQHSIFGEDGPPRGRRDQTTTWSACRLCTLKVAGRSCRKTATRGQGRLPLAPAHRRPACDPADALYSESLRGGKTVGDK
jgi:hypothetical protein